MEASSPTGKINALHEQTIEVLKEQIDCKMYPIE